MGKASVACMTAPIIRWHAHDDAASRPRCRAKGMNDNPIDLDGRRGMAAQKATELRRLLADVEANEAALRLRQDQIEAHLIAAPAANWQEAADKARYLLGLYANIAAAQDPRRQKLIAAVLEDLARLARET
jgi:hypothetical protein